jgi:hypothetical protein
MGDGGLAEQVGIRIELDQCVEHGDFEFIGPNSFSGIPA